MTKEEKLLCSIIYDSKMLDMASALIRDFGEDLTLIDLFNKLCKEKNEMIDELKASFKE